MFFSQQSQQSQRSQSSFFCWARINRSNETSCVRDRRRRKIKLAAQKNCRKNWVSNYSHNLSLDVSKHTPDTHPTKNKHTHTARSLSELRKDTHTHYKRCSHTRQDENFDHEKFDTFYESSDYVNTSKATKLILCARHLE